MTIDWLVPDERGTVAWPALPDGKKGVLTIGSFDGMHQGHQAVLRRTVELAHELKAISVAVVLDPRPAAAHAYAAAHDGADAPAGFHDPDALMPVERRLELIEALGIDRTFVVRYTMPFAKVSYVSFLGQMVGKVGMRTLVLGSDAQMGAGKQGDLKAIRNLALATGVFELEVVDDAGPGTTRIPFEWKPQMPAAPGEPADPLEGLNKAQRRTWSKKHHAHEARVWSSSNIRYMLANGRVRDVREALGRPHAVESVVVHGEQRGHTIGFPTANLGDPVHGYVPVDGVYSGWLVDFGMAQDGTDGAVADATNTASSDATDTASANAAATDAAAAPSASPNRHEDAVMVRKPVNRWPAAISVGTKETFSEATGLKERVVEAYACTKDWLELYGHDVRVEFGGFLRPQVKFAGEQELADQLAKDAEASRKAAEQDEQANQDGQE
ncbi:MAG: riboflavin kinase [Bifidobacteriaceae bacterium]|nr:riboflavin kinase [Bifidobacteriaceae bacterium]